MATVLPPPSKRQKVAAEGEKRQHQEDQKHPENLGSIRIQFHDQASGKGIGVPVAIPLAQASVKNLELLLNNILHHVCQTSSAIS